MQNHERVRLTGKVFSNKKLGGIFRERTEVRAGIWVHLLGMRVVSGCRLQGRQLSLILPRVVYEE